jgi:flagellar basal-body rod modification protein FlgD
MADIRTISNTTQKSSDEYVEQVRQKLGSSFSDQKATGKKRNEMGKDDFIKLMSAQLKHQDPMSPLKNEQMAAQLAQFSALEQMVNVNTNLEKMSAAQRPTDNVLAASLIGKKIMTDSAKFVFQKGAQPEMKFDLSKDAENLSISIVDSKGEVIRDLELGQMMKGNQALRWDGKNKNNQDALPGEYTFRVTATAPGGTPIIVNTSTAGLVSGVTFENNKAMLMVDGNKIPLEAVGRIEADLPSAAPSAAAAKSLAPQTSQASSNSAVNSSSQKQNSGEEKVTQQAKNSLPSELSEEKIKSMLGDLVSVSRMEAAEENASASEGDPPMPLWNPSNL